MGLACYVLWGLFPFYFHALRSAGAVELLAWRIVFSLALSVCSSRCCAGGRACSPSCATPRSADCWPSRRSPSP